MILWKRSLAEFIGTFAMVFAGCGAVMVADRFPGSIAPSVVPVVFGLTVAMMIYAVGHISGAHFNPAVTLAFALTRHFPPRSVPFYWAAQCLGSIAAIGLLVILLPPGRAFGTTFSSVHPPQALAWEGVLTFFLMFVIMAVATDTRAEGTMAGAAIGAAVMVAAFVGGPVTGASMNPARTLGPALFQGDLGQIWIYTLGPMLGAAGAAWVYVHLRDEPK
ncbi:MAG TPA: MIP family channel protein [bacterium]|nr:MIP family channel protein [bacterium]